jgi:alpha-galactosidase
MLEVGNGRMTHDEYKSHFSLWAALKSPLILGNDVANMTAETASILTNAEIIAVNQDPLGISAGIAERHTETSLWGFSAKITSDVWTGPLVNGDAIAGMYKVLALEDATANTHSTASSL